MDERSKNNRILIIVLSVLCVLIVALSISLLIITNSRTANNANNPQEESNTSGDELSPPTLLPNYLEEAEKIYDGNPENSQKVEDYFVNLVDEDPDNRGLAYTVAWDIWLFFMEKGNYEFALKGMMRIDASLLDEPMRYVYYKEIVALAAELGKTEIVSTYQLLRDDLQDEYEEYLNKTAQYLEQTERENDEEARANQADMEAYWESLSDETAEEGQ